jgi:NAD(P)-dependent dehydrogenase (short-subunit alcohol dehydrogenase family)
LNSNRKVVNLLVWQENDLTIRTCFRVFATARSLSKILPLSAKGVEVLELDVTKLESVAAVKSEVEKCTAGKLDFLINNA